MKEKLYVVIPAYNERENVEAVIEQWYPVIEKVGGESRLIIVNDGSSDDTYEVMQRCAETRPMFVPLTKANSGHGATLLYLYHYAFEKGADYVFQTDSDGQTEPDEFWAFWRLRENFDMVIGSRTARQDGFMRVIVSKVLKLVIGLYFHVGVEDANTPFRLMKTNVLEENLSLIPPDFFLSNVLISVIYAKKNLAVRYLPITFKNRAGGGKFC